MKGFKNPSGLPPAARRIPLSLANTPAATGQAADVPATPSKRPPEAIQYGVLVPPRAAISGYPRPVLFHASFLGSGKFASGLALYAATAAAW